MCCVHFECDSRSIRGRKSRRKISRREERKHTTHKNSPPPPPQPPYKIKCGPSLFIVNKEDCVRKYKSFAGIFFLKSSTPPLPLSCARRSNGTTPLSVVLGISFKITFNRHLVLTIQNDKRSIALYLERILFAFSLRREPVDNS